MTTTIPRRTVKPTWQIDDSLTVGQTRWVIRRLDPSTGLVVLEAMNTTNHAEWWNTTIDKLPQKAGAR